jgi:hypothetical protein
MKLDSKLLKSPSCFIFSRSSISSVSFISIILRWSSVRSLDIFDSLGSSSSEFIYSRSLSSNLSILRLGKSCGFGAVKVEPPVTDEVLALVKSLMEL